MSPDSGSAAGLVGTAAATAAALPVWAAIVDRALVAGTPLLLGTLGEVTAERAGVMNLGVEGMMSVGAIVAFATARATDSPWLGLLAAIAVGAALALLHAVVTVGLRANQVVAGLALTTLGIGISGMVGRAHIGVPLTARFTPWQLPGAGWFGPVGERWFSRDPIFFLAVALGIGLIWLMARTRWGLAIRAVGEQPLAAATMGIAVVRVRVLAVVFGGALAGMAGAHLSLVYIPAWIEGMTAGRGWIVIALTIFSGWRPAWAFVGAFLFGAIEVGQFFLQDTGWSPNLLLMLPYLATLAALVVGGIRKRRGGGAPAALGEPLPTGNR